ncbi:hypothetical protein K1719_020348 [Acacia pycnantha]|nr:hypothetical protein K1719_020348 [Acacia pycnantha]
MIVVVANRRTPLFFTDNHFRFGCFVIQKRQGLVFRRCTRILNLARNKSEIELAYQEVPDGRKESPGRAWQFIGRMPLV